MSVFQGMGPLINDVLGPVRLVHIDAAGVRRDLTARLRETPVEYVDDSGRTVLDINPELRLPATLVGSLVPGDTIVRQSDSRRFRVIARQKNSNPASDATIRFSLERIL